MFFTPKKNTAEIEDAGCNAMVALFGGKPGDNLSAMSLQKSWFSQKA